MDLNPDLAIQVAKLRADIRHIKSDITDIKADIRGLETNFEKKPYCSFDKFDGLCKKMDDLKDSIDSAKIWMIGMFITLQGEVLYIIARGIT
jgi:hypothetical protein